MTTISFQLNKESLNHHSTPFSCDIIVLDVLFLVVFKIYLCLRSELEVDVNVVIEQCKAKAKVNHFHKKLGPELPSKCFG